MQLTKSQKNVIANSINGTGIMAASFKKIHANDGGDRSVLLVPRSTVDAMLRKGLLKSRNHGFGEFEVNDEAKRHYDRSRVVWFKAVQ